MKEQTILNLLKKSINLANETSALSDYNSGKIIKQENIVIEGTDTTTIVKYKYN